MFERLFAAALGGLAGAAFWFCAAHFHFRHHDISELKWFVLVGVVLGALFGIPLARRLWSNAIDELTWDGGFYILGALVIFAMVAAFALAVHFKLI